METWLKCMVFGVDMKPKMVIGIDIFTDDSTVKTRTVSALTEWYPCLQYYNVQTLEYRYISKLIISPSKF